MARQPRIDFPGAYHHVMNRGAARQHTYRNKYDQELFLTLWQKAVSRFGIELIAFALVGNHYHVFVRSPDGQLSVTMQYIGRAYTQAFNQIHDRDGALFRGRFHSVLVDSDQYFARLARYVELNPVAAGLCTFEDLRDYRWSSYRYSGGFMASPSWLSTRHILERFGCPDEYRTFVESHIADRELERFFERPLSPGRVLGGQSFVDSLRLRHPEIAECLTAGVGHPEIEEIEFLIRSLTGARQEELVESSRPANPARLAAILLAKELSAERGFTLARRYGFSSDEALCAAVRRARCSSISDEVGRLRDAVLDQLRLRSQVR